LQGWHWFCIIQHSYSPSWLLGDTFL
jgi:hypothetical protein